MRGWGVLGVVVAALAVGCAYPIKRRDWSSFDGPGARYFHMEELDPPYFPDPVEPMNRSVATANHVLIEGIAAPIGDVYRLVIPFFVRERLRDFAANLLWPRNFLANLLQGSMGHAGTETARFAINTTVGIAGLWDPAWRWWKIEPRPEDFGQVFGVWGWRPSTFLMLPLFGPSTVRDGTGLIPDSLLDPTTYSPIPGVGLALSYNDLVDSIEPYRRFVKNTFDAYDDAHVVWTLNRDEQILEPPPPPMEGDDTSAVQTLQSAFMSPQDASFWRRLSTGRVGIASTGKQMPYSYRLQPGAAPIVFIVPGTGTHRLGAAALTLAEMAWKRGFSVALVSSAMNFEFMETAASVSVPGHAPMDARDLHAALYAVAWDLDRRAPGRIRGRVYMGYSLGAFHGFYLAAAAANPDASAPQLDFDRYVLLDPPVRLVEALTQLDRFYNAPLVYPPEKRAYAVRRILRKALAVAKASLGDGSHGYTRLDTTEIGGDTLAPSVELPFTNLEAEYLIGLSFRRALTPVLWVSQERNDQGVLLTQRSNLRRSAAYEEMSDYSYMEYLYAFVLPYYQQLGLVKTSDDLVAQNDLHAIEGLLRGNTKLRVFANKNDFLTTKADVEWLTELVGAERTQFFPTGGHLGNLNRPSVQSAIMDSIEDLRLPAN